VTRRFVALGVPVDVSDPLAAALTALRADHGGLRFTAPEDWHLTLAFCGELGDAQLEPLTTVVEEAVAVSPLPDRLRLTGGGRFGRAVLWAGVTDEPAGRVAALGARIQTGCEDAGLPVQRRAVRPHVTLARARRGAAVTAGAVAEVTAATDALMAEGREHWSPPSVEVWSSHLGDGPARYEVDAAVSG
jgi:RNA 2',3'-cyclic 3'-phosphodiesterase